MSMKEENRERQQPDHELQSDPSKPKLTRRQVLTALGAAGLLAATGASLTGAAGSAGKAEAAATGVPLPAGGPSDWKNVKDYGARGQGLPQQDDAQAIQSAINAAAYTGGVVYIPPGKYMLGSSLIMRPKVRLVGAGRGISILKAAKPQLHLLVAASIKQFAVENLTFEGTGVISADRSGYVERGIYAKESMDGAIRYCGFEMIANGIHLAACEQIGVNECTFRFVLGLSTAYEGYAVAAEAGSAISVLYNDFFSVDKPCVHLSGGCRSSRVEGNRIQKCKDAAISLSSPLEPCSNHIIRGNHISAEGLTSSESSCLIGIRLRDYCVHNVIADNVIEKAVEAAIALVGQAAASDGRPNNNRISGNRMTHSPLGINVRNSDNNAIAGNELHHAQTGIVLQTEGEGVGSTCRSNSVTGNFLASCSEAAVVIADVRCDRNAVFANTGYDNGKPVVDQGKDTIRSGF